LARFYGRAIDAIRSAEGSDGIRHLVFFEPTVAAVPVEPGFTADDQIVFAPHHYGESISPLPIDGVFDYFAALAATYPAPLWIGEYGWFEDTAQNGERLMRYAAKEDALLTAGSAWWQWRQACGDPHSVGSPGGTPASEQIHYRRNRCPGDRDGGVVGRWACLRRTFPRAAPGRLRLLRTDCGANGTIEGTTSGSGQLDLWVPGEARPEVSGIGLDEVDVQEVPGGWRVTATVSGDWSVTTRE
jgi:endoglycosylceramidase